MNILVTGGTGHLGRAVVAGLSASGHRVRVLARRPGNDPAIDWRQGDLATGEGVAAAASGIQAIVHAATHSPAAQRGGLRPLDFVRSPTTSTSMGRKRSWQQPRVRPSNTSSMSRSSACSTSPVFRTHA